MPGSKNHELDTRTQISGKYRHYKGGEYEVLGTAYHSETEELLVLYRPLNGEGAFWVRPYDMFNQKLQINGQTRGRFELIQDD